MMTILSIFNLILQRIYDQLCTTLMQWQTWLQQILNCQNLGEMIHGQKKSDKNKSEEQIKEEKDLSEKISSKLGEFFHLRNQPILPEKIPMLIEFTTILMQLCSDISTIFNYRRELVLKVLDTVNTPIQKAKTLGGDLKLITKIMQGDPKSYTLWSYRQWLVIKLFEIDPSIVEKERELCKMLLMKDEKNFHVWNYRNWVNSVKIDREQELAFTQEKINSNPFNFSPYHFRSKHISQKYQKQLSETQNTVKKQEIITYGMPKEVFDQEMETVKTAIFLNPKEEAPWLYYSWLLKQILPALLLQQKQQEDGSVSLLFSLKVSNIQKLIKLAKQQLKITAEAEGSISSKWRINFVEGVSCPLQLLSNNLQNANVKIQLETTGHQLIGSERKRCSQVEDVYEAQKKFIREVLESEENCCRFAWISLLQIIQSQIYLGVNNEKWEELTHEATQVFPELVSEPKGQKYIQKQKEYWMRLKEAENLTSIEQSLKTYQH